MKVVFNGRGKGCYGEPSYQVFTKMVNTYKPEYQSAGSPTEKTQVVHNIREKLQGPPHYMTFSDGENELDDRTINIKIGRKIRHSIKNGNKKKNVYKKKNVINFLKDNVVAGLEAVNGKKVSFHGTIESVDSSVNNIAGDGVTYGIDNYSSLDDVKGTENMFQPPDLW